jgi:predicted transposase/invertase (TIGR01784 family)
MTENPQTGLSGRPGNNHDSLFNACFSEPEAMELLLSEHLPELFAPFEPGSLKLVSGNFVDERLKARRTDLLFEGRLRNGDEACVLVMAEHRSFSDWRTPLQLMGYKASIWNNLIKEKKIGKRRLPPILPVVLYHGVRRWGAPTRLHGLFEPLDKVFRPFTEDASYALIDLGPVEDESLSRNLRQRAYLLAMKYNPRPDMRELGLARVVSLLHALPEVEILLVLRYILVQHKEISGDDLDRALREHAPQLKDGIMTGMYQEILAEGIARGRAEGIEEGLAKGLAKGRTEGRAEGRAETLLALLFHKFGGTPADVQRRIREADAETLDRWLQHVLNARSLNDVFAN